MMKTVVVGPMLLAVALSAYVTDLDNNLIEYELEDVQPMQTISLPYPYNDRNQPHIMIQPMPAAHNIILPPTEVGVSSPGLVSSAIFCIFSAVKSVIARIFSNAPALLIGSILALGICKMTSLCGSDLTIIEVQRELRSIATPERMTTVTNFVKEAIRKYTEMQI